MGLSVSEHGITDTESGEVARYATEAEVYERLGLAYIEPELREANGEIAAAAAGELPELVDARTTSAATSTATRRSPTAATRSRRWPRRREARGYAYLAVTDHSASHGFGNDVTADALLRADRGGRGRSTPRRSGASGCSPARRSTSSPTARSTTSDELLAAARLGDRQRPHLVPDLPRSR